MTKKSKSSGKLSAGIHSNVSSALLKSMRADYMASGTRIANQRRAFDAGKNVMVTMANPNTTETNKPYVRVPANQVWKRISKNSSTR